MSSEIFVFGSNDAGIHGRGAAFIAKLKYGAVQGVGEGLEGQSYAIPSKDARLRPKSLRAIKKSVDDFIAFAAANPHLTFKVTPIGTGLAGFTHDDIAPMFALVPANCIMPARWKEYLYHNEELRYWNC